METYNANQAVNISELEPHLSNITARIPTDKTHNRKLVTKYAPTHKAHLIYSIAKTQNNTFQTKRAQPQTAESTNK